MPGPPLESRNWRLFASTNSNTLREINILFTALQDNTGGALGWMARLTLRPKMCRYHATYITLLLTRLNLGRPGTQYLFTIGATMAWVPTALRRRHPGPQPTLLLSQRNTR